MRQAKDSIRELRILFGAMMTGAFLISLILTVFMVGKFPDMNVSNSSMMFTVLGTAVMIMGLVTGPLLFNNRLKAIDPSWPLMKKLEQYRAAYIIRIALLEGPLLINIIWFAFMYSNIVLFGNAVILFLSFFLIWPSDGRIIADLEFTSAEKDELL